MGIKISASSHMPKVAPHKENRITPSGMNRNLNCGCLVKKRLASLMPAVMAPVFSTTANTPPITSKNTMTSAVFSKPCMGACNTSKIPCGLASTA